MTEAQLQAFATLILEVAFWGGVLGAVCWSLLMRIFCWVADAFCIWEEKRIRIDQARMRYQHGPLLLPGLTRFERVLARCAYRARASAQAAKVRACERLGGLRYQSGSATH